MSVHEMCALCDSQRPLNNVPWPGSASTPSKTDFGILFAASLQQACGKLAATILIAAFDRSLFAPFLGFAAQSQLSRKLANFVCSLVAAFLPLISSELRLSCNHFFDCSLVAAQ